MKGIIVSDFVLCFKMHLKTKIEVENKFYWNIKIIIFEFEYLSLTVTGSIIIADSSLGGT